MFFFRGYRNTISNIAQVILVVIALPLFAIIFGAVFGIGGGSVQFGSAMSSLIGKIPMCDVWVDILYQSSGGLTFSEVASSTVLVIIKAFPEALISAICVHTCVQIFKKIARGLPIFATFIGIIIATVITGLTGLSGNIATEILIDFGVIIIMFIGIKFMLKGAFGIPKIFTGKKILLIIIDGLLAVITTAYISGLLLGAYGAFASFKDLVVRISLLTAIEMVAVVITWAVNEAVEPGEDL